MIRTGFLAFVLVLCAAPAFAHPHVWITMRSDLVYAADGSITGIRQHWAFDDMFSAFATQGLESKEKGKFTREELQPLAKVNVESLKEYAYFTFATVDGKKVPLGEPLPEITIPLLPDDPGVLTPLQPIFDRCYDAGPYRRRVQPRWLQRGRDAWRRRPRGSPA